MTTTAASFYCEMFTLIYFIWIVQMYSRLFFCRGVYISKRSVYNILDSFSLLPPWAYKLRARSTFWGLSWGKLVFGWEKTLKKTSELLSNSVFWAKSSMVRGKTLCRHLKRGHCKVTPEWRMIQLRMPPPLHYSWHHELNRFLALTNMKDLNYTRLHLDWMLWFAVNAAEYI